MRVSVRRHTICASKWSHYTPLFLEPTMDAHVLDAVRQSVAKELPRQSPLASAFRTSAAAPSRRRRNPGRNRRSAKKKNLSTSK
nr:hypothetical protein [Planctopirus ephydatiae]